MAQMEARNEKLLRNPTAKYVNFHGEKKLIKTKICCIFPFSSGLDKFIFIH
jgi:hypothetical protein